MGTKYSSNSASGYNATPPADDGTVSEANKGKWSTIKTKLGDPVKALADAINTDLVTHFDNGPVAYTSNQTLGAANYGQVIQASGSGTTLTLSDAATLGSGWNCEIISTDTTNTVTIARATASDMINETTANISLLPLQSIKAVVNASANGFLVSQLLREGKPAAISGGTTGVVSHAAGIGPGYVQNYSLAGTVDSNALTITLSGYDGTALSATNKAQFTFRSATAATGTVSVVDATANLTHVISSGSTHGATSGVPFRLWIGIVNDGGTLRLVTKLCSTSTNIYSLSDDDIISSTAEGGIGGADSAGVFYSGTAVTSKAMRVIGYMEFSLTTAGTWDEVPDKVQLWQPGMKLPGDIVQTSLAVTTTASTNTTSIPSDNTIPQNTEGTEILTLTHTPKSGVNILDWETVTMCSGAAEPAASGDAELIVALFKDSTANAVNAANPYQFLKCICPVELSYTEIATSTSATTLKIRVGIDSGSWYVNRSGNSATYLGNISRTSIHCKELMG